MKFSSRPFYWVNIFRIIDHISDSINEKLYSLGISIDLLKAFDTVDHKDHNEVKQKNLCWSERYLTCQKQSIKDAVKGLFLLMLYVALDYDFG